MVAHIIQSLRRHPGLNLAIVVTLALALSATVVVSGLIDAFLLTPLPHLDARRVMQIEEYDLDVGPGARNRISWATSRDVSEQIKAFSRVAVVVNASLTIHGRDATEVAYVPSVTPAFFPMLHTRAAVGEIINEHNAVTEGLPALLLSDSLWRRRFGADPGVIGQPVRIDNRSAMIVGVLPAGFELPSLGNGQQAWLATRMEEITPRNRAIRRLFAFAELAPHVDARDASREVAQLGQQLTITNPGSNHKRGLAATPLRNVLMGPMRSQLWILLATSVLVLLVACLNSGALLLAQAIRRRREFAVRLALGAGYGRLLRQFWAENFVLTIMAAILSLLGAMWVIPSVQTLLPDNIGVASFASPKISVMEWLVALIAAGGAAFVFSLMPWKIARRLQIEATLRGTSRIVVSGFAGRLSRWLVTGQIAVALGLAVGAALLLDSSRHLQEVDYGFPTEELFHFRVGTRGSDMSDDATRLRFFETMREQIAPLPGIKAASLAAFSYPNPTVTAQAFTQEGDGLTLDDTPKQAHIEPASPELLSTHDFRLLHGRFVTSTDLPDHPHVAVVSASLAERYWPQGDAMGKRVRLNGTEEDWTTIVGIVSDRLSTGHNPQVIDSFYIPLAQSTPPGVAVFVRFDGKQPPAFATMQRTVWNLNPDASIFFESRVDEFYRQSAWQQHLSLVLIGAFAALAIVLCAAGLYASLAFAVASRTQELGVRAALGATTFQLQTHMMRQAGMMILPGLGLGVLLAAGVAHTLGNLIYGIPTLSPMVFLTTTLLITGVCFIAAWFPSRRAMRVDPSEALREG